MMRKAENEAVKTIGFLWTVAIVAGCFFLVGCVGNTAYFNKSDVKQSGSGTKKVGLDSTATQDAEGNTPLDVKLPSAKDAVDAIKDEVDENGLPIFDNKEEPAKEEPIKDDEEGGEPIPDQGDFEEIE